MKTLKFTLLLAFTMFTTYSFTQTGSWKLAGNQLTGTEKLGSTNSAALNFITNNKTRMSLTGAGDLKFSSDQSAIQFPNPGANPKPMMLMFASGTENPNRMVIAHSPAFTNFGLQYNDVADRFDFLSAGTSIFNVSLGSSSVGVNANFNVSGTSTFTGSVNISKINSNGGNLGIGTLNPANTLHVFKGSAGVAPFFGAPLIVENSSNSYLNLLAPNNFETGVLFGNNSSNVDGGIIYNNSFNFRSIQFRTNGNITRMVLLSNGFLGVRTVSPAVEMHLLHEDGEDSHHGLRIQNVGSKNASWTLYASNQDEALSLFAKNNLVGFFNISGEYNELSDARRKKDIEPSRDVLQKVMQLNIKKYHFLENKPADKKHYGMIAQDVEKIFPEVVSHKIMDSSHSDLYAMNYGAFGVIAIKAIQEQQATIDSQKNDIKELKKLVEKLEQQITAITSSPSAQNASSATQTKIILSSAYLKQNTPNPFNEATSISYYVPENKNAFVEITTATGQLINNVPLTQKGNGQLFIEAGALKTGIYYYTLKVDGVKVDTKQMILAR